MLAPQSHQNRYPWIDQLNKQTFSWASFQFIMKAKELSFLPRYKGSTLRGGFGHTFRKVCCTMQKQDCNTCLLNKSCPYAYIFETPKVDNAVPEHEAEKLPHPFVIEPPGTEQGEFQPGDELSIGLVLFGKAASLLPYFVFTIDQMGRLGLGKGRGKFELTAGFATETVTGAAKVKIFDGATQMLISDFKEWQFSDLLQVTEQYDKQNINIELITPTRILYKNGLVSEIQFGLFIRSLLRRISLLARIHCDARWDLPYQDIIAAAEQKVRLVKHRTSWYDWERYSNRQKTRMNMGGVVGSLTYEGELAPFLPLLLLGQYTHIGKNTTFGLGKYVLLEN